MHRVVDIFIQIVAERTKNKRNDNYCEKRNGIVEISNYYVYAYSRDVSQFRWVQCGLSYRLLFIIDFHSKMQPQFITYHESLAAHR